MPARIADVQIVALCYPGGVSEETGFRLRDVFEAAKTEMWEFLNPGTFLAYFVTAKRGPERAAELVQSLALLKTEQLYAEIGVGKSSGKCVAKFGFFGGLKSSPIGIAVNEALNSAHANESTA